MIVLVHGNNFTEKIKNSKNWLLKFKDIFKHLEIITNKDQKYEIAKRTVIYTRTSAPYGWKKISKANPTNRIDVKFAIKQQNLDKLEKIFWNVHDPDSPN
jgi:hypothetical protein